MKSETCTAVAIVVDPGFGDRLSSLADQMPVWIADTPTIEPSLNRYGSVGIRILRLFA